MTSREVIQGLLAHGWFLSHSKGSHHQFKHPSRSGVVTVPHSRNDFPIGTLKSIEKQAGVKFGKR